MAHLYKKTHLFSDINFERNTKKNQTCWDKSFWGKFPCDSISLGIRFSSFIPLKGKYFKAQQQSLCVAGLSVSALTNFIYLFYL